MACGDFTSAAILFALLAACAVEGGGESADNMLVGNNASHATASDPDMSVSSVSYP